MKKIKKNSKINDHFRFSIHFCFLFCIFELYYLKWWTLKYYCVSNKFRYACFHISQLVHEFINCERWINPICICFGIKCFFISMKRILVSKSWKYTKKYFSYKNYLSILWNCVHLTYSHDGRMCVELSKGFTMYHPWGKKRYLE